MNKFKTDAAYWKQDDAVLFDDEAMERIDAVEKKLQFVFSMDSGEAAFFARQLEFVKSKTYDVKYPNLRAQELLPVSTEAGPGANTITYRQYNQVGQMKFIAQYAKDLPRVDIFGKEFHAFVKSMGESYGYTIQEVRNAMYANVPLQQRKANAARLAYEQAVNRNAWFADGSASYAGCMGLFYNTNITQMAAPTGGWCDSTGASLGKTPDQIIADVNTAINYVPQLTKMVESVNTVLMPSIHLSYIKTTMRSTISDSTIYEVLTKNHPGVSFEALNEAFAVTPSPATPTVGGSSTNILLAYDKNPDKLTLEIPQPFEQFPVQEVGLEYEIPCHARYAGVITYYPLSILLMYGI
jgi:hypothetical protein